MAEKRFKLYYPGLEEIRKSPEVENLVSIACEGVADRAGDEYIFDTRVGKQRIIGMVKPGTPHAYYSNLKYNTLAKALGGG